MASTTAQVLSRQAPHLLRQGNPFTNLYSGDGLQLVFDTPADLRRVLTVTESQLIYEAWSKNVVFPASVQLNSAFVIDTPVSQNQKICFEVALMFQVCGPALRLTCCTASSPTPWNPLQITKTCRCIYSRFFQDREIVRSPVEAVRLQDLLSQQGLDTLAVFKSPYLFMVQFKKEKEIITSNNMRVIRQDWYAEQGCLNCMAAGTWQNCTHYMLASGLHRRGNPFATFDLPPGDRSELDEQEDGAQVMRVFAKRVKECSLLSAEG